MTIAADDEYVKTRRQQAAWYAFGYNDARKRYNRHAVGGVDEFAFGIFASNEARGYREGKLTFLPSIQDQFDRFMAEFAQI